MYEPFAARACTQYGYGYRVPYPSDAGPIVGCGFPGNTSRSNAAEWRWPLRRWIEAQVNAHSFAKYLVDAGYTAGWFGKQAAPGQTSTKVSWRRFVIRPNLLHKRLAIWNPL